MNGTKNYFLDLGSLLTTAEELPRIYSLDDRYKHAYIIGKTGTGKSTLMLNMALNDIRHGLAVIYIDPKGDAVKTLSDIVPEDRLITLSINSPLGINPLRKKGYNLSDTINEFVEILDVLIKQTSSNPESTVLMREIIDKAVRSFPPSYRRLDYLTNFLLYEKTRKHHLETVNVDQWLREYWLEFDAMDRNIRRNREKIESAKRVASRLDRLTADERMRNIVCKENELDIGEIGREGKVFLVDASRTDIFNAIYLANLITHAVKSHCEFIGNDRPLMVYVDEFGLCFSSLFSRLLATARSHKVGFVLAHQNMFQIDKALLEAVLGNCHTYITFQCGETEANRMARIYNLEYQIFLNLKPYEAYCRIGTNNTKVATDPPPFIPPKIPKYSFLKEGWIAF